MKGKKLTQPIIIQTYRCLLSEMKISDSKYWFKFMNNEQINKYLTDRIESEKEMIDILNWLISNYNKDISSIERLTLSISMKDNNKVPIGWITYGQLPENEELKEIAYAIEPVYWGKGIATETVAAFIKYIKTEIPISNLYASVDRRNIASIRILDKIGMKKTKIKAIDPIENHDVFCIGE